MAQTHVVKEGENLSTIAQNLGVNVNDISGYRSGNPNLIFPGEQLTIGTTAPATAAPTTPQNSEDVANILKQTQEAAFVEENQAAYPDGTPEGIDFNARLEQVGELQTALGGEAPPELPNLVDTFTNLQEEYGLTALNKEIADLKLEEQNIQARLRQRRFTEEGKPVALSVIAGRVTEIDRQERENLDFVQRQISFRTDQAQAAYQVVNTIMSLTNQDFQNAQNRYETQFNQKLALYKQLEQEETAERDFQFKLTTERKNNARANLEIYMQTIKDGGLKYSDLTQETKLEISKMEVQSGLGVGFVSKLRVPPQDQIKSITQRTDPSGRQYADAIIVGDDGKLRVQSTYIGQTRVASSGGGGGGAPSATQIKAQQEAEMKQYAASMGRILTSQKGNDGYTSPETYRQGRETWISEGLSAEEYDAQFRQFVNPSHWWDYGNRGILGKYFNED